MNRSEAKWAAVGAGLAFLGVALGAFGAHALRSRISAERVAVYQTGVQYHVVHAIGILVVVALGSRLFPKAAGGIASLFAAGIVIFGGSLYALAITDIKWFGAITPLGGLCFLAGWGWMAIAAWRSDRQTP